MNVLKAQSDAGRKYEHQNKPLKGRSVHNGQNRSPEPGPFEPHFWAGAFVQPGASEKVSIRSEENAFHEPITGCRK